MENGWRTDGLPRQTTPTWEVELLISGVAVFAMLQLPGLLDDALFALAPRFEPQWAAPMQMMYLYLKSAAVILAITFSFHLLLRAHWIALVGMHSVFPAGARKDRLRMGPIQRGVEERSAANRDVVVDRADNRATVVFAVGVAMATILVTLSLLVVLLFGLASLLLRATGLQVENSLLFSLAALLVAGTFGIARFVDRRLGAKLAPDGRVARVLAAIFGFYRRIGFGNGNSVMALVSSHGGERRTVLLTFAVFLPVMFSVMFGIGAMARPERLGSYALFPADAPPGAMLEAAHYDSLRQPSRDPAVPYVQDPVVVGPYLRLVVPFLPGADDAAMRRTCPDAADAAAALACLQALHPVSIDGKPVEGLRYDAGSDTRTARPALVAMIDVRGLARGRHELRVARTEARALADGETEHVIPFWR